MIYAGIGSRRTPNIILRKMIILGELFGKWNFTLRSGGATGADTAFETGCDRVNGKKEIYLPWKGFNNNTSELYDLTEDAVKLAKKFHPKFNSLTYKAKQFHSRNSYQVLGYSLNKPANFIMCYTDGTGGTQQALRIAKYYKIPIFNMYESTWFKELKEYLQIYVHEKKILENFI